MIKLISDGMYYVDGQFQTRQELIQKGLNEKELDEAYKGTMAYTILKNHNTAAKTAKGEGLKIKFDAMASHDITYVGITLFLNLILKQ